MKERVPEYLRGEIKEFEKAVVFKGPRTLLKKVTAVLDEVRAEMEEERRRKEAIEEVKRWKERVVEELVTRERVKEVEEEARRMMEQMERELEEVADLAERIYEKLRSYVLVYGKGTMLEALRRRIERLEEEYRKWKALKDYLGGKTGVPEVDEKIELVDRLKARLDTLRHILEVIRIL